jgi:hypothetical protein
MLLKAYSESQYGEIRVSQKYINFFYTAEPVDLLISVGADRISGARVAHFCLLIISKLLKSKV